MRRQPFLGHRPLRGLSGVGELDFARDERIVSGFMGALFGRILAIPACVSAVCGSVLGMPRGLWTAVEGADRASVGVPQTLQEMLALRP